MSELDIVLCLIEGRLISTFLASSLLELEHSDNSTGAKDLRCGALLGNEGLEGLMIFSFTSRRGLVINQCDDLTFNFTERANPIPSQI